MDFLRRLKPHHLRLIVRIADTGKLQVAASALAMSQPAASRILTDIEADSGAQLFIRHPKGMEPTQAGTAFVKHARSVLNALDSLESEVGGINMGQAGEVRVGSVTGPAIKCLVPALLEVKRASPKIEPTFAVGPSVDLVRGLEARRFDFVIARLPPDYDSRDFQLLPARSEVISLLVHARHPLAGAKGLTLEALTEFGWVIQERGSPIRQAVETAFAEAGIRPPSNITNSSSMLVVLSLLRESDTVAPVSAEVAGLLTQPPLSADLRVLDLAVPMTVAPYFLIRHRSQQLSRAAETLMRGVLARL
ncbi:LysR substrate-binding domain-containing protein [Salipiger mucosus]|nr:LysR substrate-binding domain-containing protein [Salipiger mucosus]